jgi:hypothetical protein
VRYEAEGVVPEPPGPWVAHRAGLGPRPALAAAHELVDRIGADLTPAA